MNSKRWALLLSCVLAGAAGAWAANWDPEVQVSTGNEENSWTSYNNAWCVAVDHKNRVHVVWQDCETQTFWQIYYNRSTDGGVTWQGQGYPSAGGSDNSPAVAVDSLDHVHVVWVRDGSIWYNRSTDAGVSWDGEEVLYPGSEYRSLSIATDPQGRVHLVWQVGTDKTQAFYARSTDEGETWQQDPFVLVTGAARPWNPSVAADAWGGVHVTWYDARWGGWMSGQGRRAEDYFGNWEIYFRRSLDGGESWTEDEQRLTTDDAASILPCVMADGYQGVHVTWSDSRDGNYEIYHKRSPSRGAPGSWTLDKRVTEDLASSERPSIATDFIGRIHITWLDYSICGIFYTFSTDAGTTWSGAERVDDPLPSRTSENASIAMDRVGGIHVVWDRVTQVYYRRARPEPILGSTEPSQGRHLVRNPWDGTLHLVFHSNDEHVYYTTSADNGYTWAVPYHLDAGRWPSLGLILGPYESPIICVAYNGWQSVGTRENKYQWLDLQVGHWQGPYPMGGEWEIGPPSLVTFGDSVIFAYRAADWFANWVYARVFRFDIPWENRTEYLDQTANPDEPCLAVDESGLVHGTWKRSEGHTYYSERHPDQSGYWPSPVMLDPLMPAPSKQPFVECYAESVFVVWAEEDANLEVWRRARWLFWPPWIWGNPVDVSSSPELASESPTQAWQSFTIWAEDPGSGMFDTKWWSPVWGSGYVNPTPEWSYWPHSQMWFGWFGSELATAGTESKVPYQPPYWIATNHLMLGFFGGDGGVYYAVGSGDSAASPYCRRREGVLRFGEKKVDFARDSLVYELPLLNPNYDYYLKVSSYRETGNDWTQALSVDGGAYRALRFAPNRVDTAWIQIPPMAYERDRRVMFSLKNVQGDYVTTLGLTLYQRDPKRRGKGGPQSGEPASLNTTDRFAIFPNPATSAVQVEYSLKKAGVVDVAVYDIHGGLVRRLVKGLESPGSHRLVWDGRNGKGEQVPSGVYLIRSTSEEKTKTGKVVLLR